MIPLQGTVQIVGIRISTHFKIPPPLSCQAPLKTTNCPSPPPFVGNPPYILAFQDPPLNVRSFSEPQKY